MNDLLKSFLDGGLATNNNIDDILNDNAKYAVPPANKEIYIHTDSIESVEVHRYIPNELLHVLWVQLCYDISSIVGSAIDRRYVYTFCEFAIQVADKETSDKIKGVYEKFKEDVVWLYTKKIRIKYTNGEEAMYTEEEFWGFFWWNEPNIWSI